MPNRRHLILRRGKLWNLPVLHRDPIRHCLYEGQVLLCSVVRKGRIRARDYQVTILITTPGRL